MVKRNKKNKKNNTIQKLKSEFTLNVSMPLSNSEKKMPKSKASKIPRKERKSSDQKRISSIKKNKFKRIMKNLYILKPLKELYFDPKMPIKKMKINELMEFADKNDLNPEVNYIILSHLKKNNFNDYKRYIKKYKYTLNFKEAIILECFDTKEIDKMIKEYNNIIKFNKFSADSIVSSKNIKSFSKIKLFNLLMYLLNSNILSNPYDVLEKKIRSYSVELDLVYKTPSRYGNNELKYYLLLLILIDKLLPQKGEGSTSDTSYDLTSSLKKGIYFDFKTTENIEYKSTDITEILERKNLILDYVKNIKIEHKAHKEKIINKKIIENNLMANLTTIVSIIQGYKANIIELFQSKDDKDIIPRIKFIIFSIDFLKNNDNQSRLIFEFSNCLKLDASSYEEYKKKKYNNNTVNIIKNNKYKGFSFSNFDNFFPYCFENPFNYKAKYFDFPLFLDKSMIRNDEELFNEFKNFLKYIYTSKIIKDIFYLSTEFNEFLFPFDDNDILDELLDFTNFWPLPNNELRGFTEKEFPEIFIGTNLVNNINLNDNFSKIITQISQILNTCIHEHLKHYLKALIFYNSFRLGKEKRINSDGNELDEERNLVNRILKKNNNEYDCISLDGGEKAEVFLYGNTLDKIYLPQSLELFKLKNWNKSIPEHIENFNNCINNKPKSETIETDKIIKDDNLCQFYKLLVQKFNKFFNENSNNITYSNTTFSAKNTNNIIIDYKKDCITYDNTAVCFYDKRNKKDSSY